MFETGISVACEVTKGIFMSEYFVRISMGNENLWQGTVDKEMVLDLKEEPSEGKMVGGRMYAYLISYDTEKAIIELPGENVGRRIYVPLNFIRKEKIPA